MTMSALEQTSAILVIEPEASVPVTRYLTEEGTLTQAGLAAGLNIELAQQLYQDMARARRFDSEALALQRQGELSLWLMSWGQEAAQVGSVRALRDSDMIFPSYREHAVGLTRGLTPGQLMAQWRGVCHSGWAPGDAHMQMYALVLGTQTLQAVGYATGVAMEASDEIVVVYLGDGAASQGDVNEALNWAAASKLPILFFVQNNQWAISTPADQQMGAPLHRRAAGFGVRGYHVDGNDALAVHAVTTAAANRIRQGGGPALIEAQTYRMGGHSSSDDPKRYRTDDDVAKWEARDPLVRLRRLLEQNNTPPEWFERLDQSLEELADVTRNACRSLSAPSFDELFDQVYAEPHEGLRADRLSRTEIEGRL